MGKILILAHHFPPFFGGGVIRVVKFCKYLTELGWELIVVTVGQQEALKPDNTLLEEIDRSKVTIIYTEPYLSPGIFRYADMLRRKKLSTDHIVTEKDKKAGSHPRDLAKGLTKAIISLLRKLLYGYILIPDRGILWKWKVIRHVRKIRKEHNIDLVFSTAPPNSTHLIAMKVRRMLKVPWVAEFRDAWVDNPFFMSDGITTSSKIAREKKMEKKVCENADLVIAVTIPATEGLKSRYPDMQSKFAMLPNGYDPGDFSSFPHKPPPSDKLRIKYIGSIGGSRNPESLFRALEKISTTDLYHNIELEFIGEFSYDREYWEKKLPILKFQDTVPHKEAIQRMKDADVLLLFQDFDSGSMYAVPGKMYEYIASMRPIWGLLDRGPARDMVEKEGLGYLSYPQDMESIRTALEQIHRDWQKNQLKIGNRERLLEEYSRKSVARRLSTLFNDLIARGSKPRPSISGKEIA